MSGMKIGGGLSGAFGGGKAGGMEMPDADLSGKGRQDIGINGSRNSGSQEGNGLSSALNFGSSALSKVGGQGVQFGSQATNDVTKNSSGSEGGQGANSDQNSITNSLTQLLNAIVQLLQGKGAEGSNKTGSDASNASGNGSSGSQQASGSGDIMTQLMDMIKKMLGQSSGDNSTGNTAGNNTGSGTSGSQDASGSGDIMTQLMDLIKKMLGQSSDSADASGQSGTGTGTGSSPTAAQSNSGTQDGSSQNSSGIAGKLGGALQMLGLGAILSALQGGGASAQGGSESSK